MSIEIHIYSLFYISLILKIYFLILFYLSFFLVWIPRLWYFRSFQYKIVNMHLLRTGKAVKVETHTLAGDRNFAWTENYQFHPLTQD